MMLVEYIKSFGEIQRIKSDGQKFVQFKNCNLYGIKTTDSISPLKWYALNHKLLENYKNNNYKGIIFIINGKGSIPIPLSIIEKYLPFANDSKQKDNTEIRQYHIRIKNVKGLYFLYGKQKYTENIQSYFRPLINIDIYNNILAQKIMRIKNDIIESNPIIRTLAIQLIGNTCSKCLKDFSSNGNYIGIHNNSWKTNVDEINISDDIILTCDDCYDYFIEKKKKESDGLLDKIFGHSRLKKS